MRSIIFYCLAVLCGLLCLGHCDELDDAGYSVSNSGDKWTVSSGGYIINEFRIDGNRIKVDFVANGFDEKGVSLRDIIARVWGRAGKWLSDLDSVQFVDVMEYRAMNSIAQARQMRGVGPKTSFQIDMGEIGWGQITDNPFYWHVHKMCWEWNSMEGKDVTGAYVSSLEDSEGIQPDDLIFYIAEYDQPSPRK
ncbi:hypothetical protein HER10_EVM0005755 [Colletotrichum scovillei]|uniref:Nudix domain-containing protein n=3 Tax=Colletotrichum acutatum species complex TaxID=2707335 RepID=A0A9P7UHP4_9PEZI|nr:uncharacterized protein HER10_EVM0005755 [Colletotrichum scovillei]KXH31562.1 hypothetical protein CSIM01_12341 [Colletotrichum simmondsii]KXH49985.1 hypothetical protein CNYM01_12409 [Colletotrichum nymphaeae SA-01]KAF4776381.1 hypothetical protein HER10_EVM0005755 [Colletotrichum scovillei]KAG7053722.1 Nudix domain-containing protein [Colletotrichum scovillei]KAG7072018.1 Nudix domain-containing protein [Colletotrichum scovillei]